MLNILLSEKQNLGKTDVVRQNDAENTMEENGNKMDTLASDSKVIV